MIHVRNLLALACIFGFLYGCVWLPSVCREVEVVVEEVPAEPSTEVDWSGAKWISPQEFERTRLPRRPEKRS